MTMYFARFPCPDKNTTEIRRENTLNRKMDILSAGDACTFTFCFLHPKYYFFTGNGEQCYSDELIARAESLWEQAYMTF